MKRREVIALLGGAGAWSGNVRHSPKGFTVSAHFFLRLRWRALSGK
jgi:hypothetical protein